MPKRAAHASLALPPYAWGPAAVRKVKVHTAMGMFRVAELMPDGSVYLQKNRGPKFAAPKRVGFVDCPACNTPHEKMSRQCTVCGESMVYFPQPDKGVLRALRKRSLEVEAEQQKRELGDVSARRQLMTVVRSSVSHYLFKTCSFGTPEELVAAEKSLPRLLGVLSLNTSKDVLKVLQKWGRRWETDEHAAAWQELVDRRVDKATQPRHFLLGLLLAAAADAGQQRFGNYIVEQHGSKLPVSSVEQTKYLTQCWVSESYHSQAVVRGYSQIDVRDA